MTSRGYELVGVHHLQLAMPRGEEAAAVDFYGDLLGLEKIPKPDALAPRGGVWFRSGSLQVHLGQEDNFHPAVRAHPAFLVNGLSALVKRLEAAGMRIDDDVQLDGYRRFYVRDPFGNRLELIEPTP